MLKDAIKLANKVMALDDEDYTAFAEILRDKQRGQAAAQQDDEKPKKRKRRKKAATTPEPQGPPEADDPGPVPTKPAKAAAKPAKRQPKQKTIDEAVASTSKDPLDEALEGVL